MLKQTSTPYNGQLLALRTSVLSVKCIGLPCNVTLITPHLLLFPCYWHWQRWQQLLLPTVTLE